MFEKYKNLWRGLLVTLGLGGLGTGFYFFGNSQPSSQAAPGVPPSTLLGSITPSSGGAAYSPPGASGGSGSPRAGEIEGAKPPSVRAYDAATVFSFDIRPEWIISHWPNVSTGLAQLQLEGYRVPLVTGTAAHDLAGSLTYYFNAEQKLQRITFTGVTGDPRPLIGLLSSRFRLTRRLTNDPGMVVYEAVRPSNQPASGFRIRLAPLKEPTDSQRRYDIELSLEQSAH